MPTRKQAYNENYKLTRIQKSDDPVKSLIAKQRADGLIGREIIRKIIVDDESFIVVLFTDNTSESMNKSIKDWQERKKLDCVRFAEEFEDLILQQESDILRTFLGVSIIRKEYLHLAIKFNTDFSNRSRRKSRRTEKRNVKN